MRDKISKNEEKIIPYQCPQKPYHSKNSYLEKGPEINIENQEFISSTFSIKNLHQETELNEICLFKFKENLKTTSSYFILEVTLWRFVGNVYNKDEIEKKMAKKKIDLRGFEMVFKNDFIVPTLKKNFSQFLPVLFSPHRTAVLYLGFNSFILCLVKRL